MKIDTHTLAVLSRSTPKDGLLFLPGQLERPDYLRVAKVIEAMGGKWNRAVGAHVFAGGDAADALEQVLATGEIGRPQEMGFFATQGHALEMLMDVADVRFGHRVLEPSAGVGNIVLGVLAAGAKEVIAFEADEARALALRGIRSRLGVTFAPAHGDFLAVQPPLSNGVAFDRVVMNPPFRTPGHPRADLEHVAHASAFLRPGGRLAAVMGAGVTFREDNRTVKFHERICHLSPAWYPMPEGSFKASGTGVSTILLTLDMPA